MSLAWHIEPYFDWHCCIPSEHSAHAESEQQFIGTPALQPVIPAPLPQIQSTPGHGPHAEPQSVHFSSPFWAPSWHWHWPAPLHTSASRVLHSLSGSSPSPIGWQMPSLLFPALMPA